MSQEIDLGEDHVLRFTQWKPDRDLNPQYAHLSDVDRLGAVVRHKTPDGGDCMSGIYFDTPETKRVIAEAFPDRSTWTVESWDPLTISPSLLCRACGDHGFIREGKWVKV